MEKLELKHLVPYLPYRLTGICTEENQGIEIVNGISWNEKYSEVSTNIDALDITVFKPLLRPISDLLKEDSENYNLMLSLCDILNSNTCEYFIKAIQEKTYYSINLLLYDKLCVLLDGNHFDWRFGLIEKGLAVTDNLKKL